MKNTLLNKINNTEYRTVVLNSIKNISFLVYYYKDKNKCYYFNLFELDSF